MVGEMIEALPKGVDWWWEFSRSGIDGLHGLPSSNSSYLHVQGGYDQRTLRISDRKTTKAHVPMRFLRVRYFYTGSVNHRYSFGLLG